jgi:hypothetical protein
MDGCVERLISSLLSWLWPRDAFPGLAQVKRLDGVFPLVVDCEDAPSPPSPCGDLGLLHCGWPACPSLEAPVEVDIAMRPLSSFSLASILHGKSSWMMQPVHSDPLTRSFTGNPSRRCHECLAQRLPPMCGLWPADGRGIISSFLSVSQGNSCTGWARQRRRT